MTTKYKPSARTLHSLRKQAIYNGFYSLRLHRSSKRLRKGVPGAFGSTLRGSTVQLMHKRFALDFIERFKDSQDPRRQKQVELMRFRIADLPETITH